MSKVSSPKVVGKDRLEEVDLPEHVTIALREIAGAAKEGLLALSVGVGLAVVEEIFEGEVATLAGPKGKHDHERTAFRHGHEPRRITLGGRLVGVAKPRVRSTENTEVELSAYRHFADRDLLEEAALGRMLAGLSARRYDAGLEPVGDDVKDSGTSRSAVSRRFVRGTEKKLAELFGRDLSELNLLAFFIDGMNVGDHTLVVALGVDDKGVKHPLGLWEGTTENKAVARALIADLIDRGLDTESAMLFVIDGGKAIRAAIKDTFGDLALIQRCRKHKKQNVLDHLPKSEQTFISRKLNKAWSEQDPKRAEAELRSLARHLEDKHPGAAASLLEGLDETLTVTRLGLTPSLLRTFKTTNPVESMISIARDSARYVKRWRSGKMALRWTAAGMLEAEKQFRRVNGCRELHILKRALNRHKEVVLDSRQKVA
jgi:putative transposase